MSQPILSIATWVSLPNQIRDRIRVIFKIPRSAHVQVNDGRVETDGTTPEDFLHLTSEKMKEYLGSNSTDFLKLFDEVVARVLEDLEKEKTGITRHPENPAPHIGQAPTALHLPGLPHKKRQRRPRGSPKE